MALLSDSIQTLPGIGPKKAELFARLGIRTLGELLHFYPRDYEDRSRLLPISALEPEQSACFCAYVVTEPCTHRIPKPGNRQLEVTKVTVADHTGRLNLTFFNSAYTAGLLRRGERYRFYGALSGDAMGYAMINPLFEPAESVGGVTGCIVPIYPLTAGLTNRQVCAAVQAAIERCAVTEPLAKELRNRYGLCDAERALHEIHRPSSAQALKQARSRLSFEEFYIFSAALAVVRSRRTFYPVAPMQTDGMERFYEALPFSLTSAQSRAIAQILKDFRSGIPMSRLVQGDVGCGKTMVAAAAAYCAAKNGRQVALMAPTEILARQHYKRLAPLLAALGLRCALLTGSLTPPQKRKLREQLAGGEYAIVIGTHALLTGETEFSDLGLVIADEQHRFGVAQRAALLAKGAHPHLLIMSATPIPRTLALLLYGDLEVSVIDELPPGRQPVKTFLVNEAYRARLNHFIRQQAAQQHQTFIVCPAIEEGETESLKATVQWAQTLQEYVFPNLRVALLHGKMKGVEKEATMAAFAAREYDILVCTTVIEVGVDVPNATLMVIENADRFGLSQLHQLRGRVGRGGAESFCVLVSDSRSNETLARLKALCATTDGFRIAEEDLKLRGPGDFFGSRQHGLPAFQMKNPDMQQLLPAQKAAFEAVAQGKLPEALQKEIDALLNSEALIMS